MTNKPDFNDWIKGKDGRECMQWPVPSSEYLKNRLFWAFDAGRDRVWSQFIEGQKRNNEMYAAILKAKEALIDCSSALIESDNVGDAQQIAEHTILEINKILEAKQS